MKISHLCGMKGSHHADESFSQIFSSIFFKTKTLSGLRERVLLINTEFEENRLLLEI